MAWEKRGLYVEVRDNNITKAWRKFKRLVQEDGVLDVYKEKQHYEKASDRRRKERAMAKARWKKKERELENSFYNVQSDKKK
jgi:ribosomal protein S21